MLKVILTYLSFTHDHCRSREECTRILKSLSSNANDPSSADKPAAEDPRRNRGRSKSPHRASLSKSPKPTSATPINNHHGSPASHITSLLLKGILNNCHEDNTLELSGLNPPFLSTLDYMNMLSDLVLAIPACGAAIHRFKPPKDFKVHK
jgi:hypothetical protein